MVQNITLIYVIGLVITAAVLLVMYIIKKQEFKANNFGVSEVVLASILWFIVVPLTIMLFIEENENQQG